MSGPHSIEIRGVNYFSHEQAGLALGICVHAAAHEARRKGLTLGEAIDAALARKAARDQRRRVDKEARRVREAEAAARAAAKAAKAAKKARRARPWQAKPVADRIQSGRRLPIEIMGVTYSSREAASEALGICVFSAISTARRRGVTLDEAVQAALDRAARHRVGNTARALPSAAPAVEDDDRLPPLSPSDLDWSSVRALGHELWFVVIRVALLTGERGDSGKGLTLEAGYREPHRVALCAAPAHIPASSA